MGDCPLCGPEASFLRGVHRKCHSLQESCWDEMVEIAPRAAESSGFSQAPLRLDLMAVPQRSRLGRPQLKVHRRTASCPRTRGPPWCATSNTSVCRITMWTPTGLTAIGSSRRLSVNWPRVSFPDRLGCSATHPFNLMKSEMLAWSFGGVQHVVTKIMRARCGTFHDVNIHVARGVHYRPGTSSDGCTNGRTRSTWTPAGWVSPSGTSTPPDQGSATG